MHLGFTCRSAACLSFKVHSPIAGQGIVQLPLTVTNRPVLSQFCCILGGTCTSFLADTCQSVAGVPPPAILGWCRQAPRSPSSPHLTGKCLLASVALYVQHHSCTDFSGAGLTIAPLHRSDPSCVLSSLRSSMDT